MTTGSGEDALPLGETQQRYHSFTSATSRGREEEKDTHTHTHTHTHTYTHTHIYTHTHTHHGARLKPLHNQDNNELPNNPPPA